MKKNAARRPADTAMESPAMTATYTTGPIPDPGPAVTLIPAVTLVSVRRNWWGTWSGTGTYSGPRIDQAQPAVSGWGWTRSQAILRIENNIAVTQARNAIRIMDAHRTGGQNR